MVKVIKPNKKYWESDKKPGNLKLDRKIDELDERPYNVRFEKKLKKKK